MRGLSFRRFFIVSIICFVSILFIFFGADFLKRIQTLLANRPIEISQLENYVDVNKLIFYFLFL